MSSKTFQVIILGSSGGPLENNLSGYLIASLKNPKWIVCDAGSLLSGLVRAFEQEKLQIDQQKPDLHPAREMLMHHIKGYLISHAHLDHIAGLVINSQLDTPKPIYGIESVIEDLKNHIFNGRIWPNYGNEGENPLSLYTYTRLPFEAKVPIKDTDFTVQAFPLHHPGSYLSTAFLIQNQEGAFLYVGDTSPDEKENEPYLANLWKNIAPLLQNGMLKGIFLECSYPKRRENEPLYGHLDTHYMVEELCRLKEIAGVSLEEIPILVTHRKNRLQHVDHSMQKIEQELLAQTRLKAAFQFPQMGDRIFL